MTEEQKSKLIELIYDFSESEHNLHITDGCYTEDYHKAIEYLDAAKAKMLNFISEL